MVTRRPSDWVWLANEEALADRSPGSRQASSQRHPMKAASDHELTGSTGFQFLPASCGS
jgi:hypothetical protein